MAITFVQTAFPAAGAFIFAASPVVTASFTPGGGNFLIVFGISPGSGPGNFITGVTGTGTYSAQGSYHVDLDGDIVQIFANLSSTASSQTTTISGQDRVGLLVADYGGVGYVGTPLYTDNATPGTGFGAILGAPIVVQAGSSLLAFCYDSTGNVMPTIVGTAGTQRLQVIGPVSSVLQEYAGAGSIITPSFTTSGASSGSENYTVMQILMGPPIQIAWTV